MWLGSWAWVVSRGLEIEERPFAVVVWVVLGYWRFVVVSASLSGGVRVDEDRLVR